VTKDLLNVPAARSWRDIPQPVKPRAMSRGGRWRFTLALARGISVVAFLAALGWGGWTVVAALQENPRLMPAAAKAVPILPPELRTDGVLTSAWLGRTLALPRGASLMSLDLEKLRTRLLGEGQVLTANLTRRFPDRLVVDITERTPVARVMADWGGQPRELLVARDGIVFAGEGHDRAMLETLPWLDGLKISRRGEQFLPIEGIEAVSELLATARLEAEHLYRSWRVVSLARLAADRVIEVRTIEGVTIVFAAEAASASGTLRRQGFFRQLVRLDYLWDNVAHVPGTRARVDLSLGREVPVMIEAVPGEGAPDGAVPRRAGAARPAPTFSFLPLQPKTNREL
jgi:hypothetical protein